MFNRKELSKEEQIQRLIHMAKKKRHGHYCKICGECKANEKFTVKGHRNHICKACQSLPASEQPDMRRVHDVGRILLKYSPSPQDRELLKKYAEKFSGKESGMLAQSILDELRQQAICYSEDMEDTVGEYEFVVYMNEFLKGN